MNLRDEALLMLEKRGAVLEAAGRVSRVLKSRRIDGGVIGGIAVVLHGHVRTTRDVDVLVKQPLEDCRAAFEAEGILFDAEGREFLCDGVPVHLVPAEMVRPVPKAFIEREGVTTVSLADLISMKLHSGTGNVVRSQDIADVIGLIRQHGLTGAFAPQVDEAMRGEFKKLVQALKGA